MIVVPEDLYDAEAKVDELLEKFADPLIGQHQKSSLENQIKAAYLSVKSLRNQYGLQHG